MVLPEHLSVLDNATETLTFFKNLESAFLHGRAGMILIDHSHLKQLTPEAGLLLIAEFHRLTRHAPLTRLLAVGRSPSDEVEDLLQGIGYNDYFSTKKSRSRISSSLHTPGKIYIKHCYGTEVIQEDVQLMVEHFQDLVKFSPIRAERLSESLGECMTNVVGHAYPSARAKEFRWGRRRWWLLGYTDPSCNEIYFAFLDQGVGMPATLKKKAADYLLFQFSDAELVLNAFKKPRSSSGQTFRGRGLPTLRRYVLEAPNGELVVQTGDVRCSFVPKKKARVQNTEVGLAGTLLVWHVNSSHDDHGK